MMKRCKYTKQLGMTLLEVMLSLVILATAGIAVMKAASEALNNQGYLQDKTLAMWVASNQLAMIKLNKEWPRESWKSGESQLAGVTWYWRYQTVATGDVNFKALDIEVSDKKEGGALAYIRTYIAQP